MMIDSTKWFVIENGQTYCIGRTCQKGDSVPVRRITVTLFYAREFLNELILTTAIIFAHAQKFFDGSRAGCGR